jgi:hypothetical protein
MKVEITVVFAADVPDDCEVSHMGVDLRTTDVLDDEGDYLGRPVAYTTTNVEVIEKP